MEFLIQFGLVIILVLLNGFFVASEFALVSVRKTRIDELVKGGAGFTAVWVQGALKNLDQYIAATQLGITLSSLALGWIGEPAIAHFLEPLFATFLPGSSAFVSAHIVAVAIAFAIITALHIVIGELAPKSIALQRPESTSLWVVVPLTVFLRVFSPFIRVLNNAGWLVLRLIGFTQRDAHHSVHSEEEIRALVAQSVDQGIIPRREAEMLNRVFRFADTQVEHIMVPRTDIIALDISMTLQEIEDEVRKHPHSRFPVYKETIDTIIGFVHIKDIYRETSNADPHRTLSETTLLRRIIDIPESTRIDEVLLQMKKKQIHIAVISDEYRGTAGIVTLEDVLESLVGEIQDEFEQPEQDVVKQSDGSFLIDGLAAVEKVQSAINVPIKGHGYTTIGGLVFGLLGRQPVVGDTVQIGTLVLKVETMDEKRVAIVRVHNQKSAV